MLVAARRAAGLLALLLAVLTGSIGAPPSDGRLAAGASSAALFHAAVSRPDAPIEVRFAAGHEQQGEGPDGDPNDWPAIPPAFAIHAARSGAGSFDVAAAQRLPAAARAGYRARAPPQA